MNDEPQVLVLCANPALEVTFEAGVIGDGVYSCPKTTWESGGKGINVARILKSLKTFPVLVGFIGGCVGKYIQNQLKEESITCCLLDCLPETRCSVVIVNQTGGSVVVRESGRPVIDPQISVNTILKELENRLPGAQCLCVAGSIPPGVPATFYRDVCRMAKLLSKPVFLDCGGEPLREALSARPFLVKPNEEEFAALIWREIEDEAERINAMQEIQRMGAENVVLSLGAKGVLAAVGTSVFSVEVPKVEPINAIGAGDALCAGMIWAFVTGQDWQGILTTGAALGTAATRVISSGRIPADFSEELMKVRIKRIS